jgi:glycosyltransferase involved in cell wall biosynthesis
MRIGVNCFLLQKNMGGLRQYFHTLFRELLATDQENRYTFFYFEHNLEEMEFIGNERWKEGAVLLKDQREVVLHFGRMDLYFCPFGAIWPRPVPIPSVLTLVDIQEKYYPQFFTKQDLWNRGYHFDASTKAADQVITISEYSKTSIAFHHRIPKSKIHVAYLSADDCFYQSFEEEQTRLELPERFLFYPANRWPHKNHDNLFRALVILKHEYHLSADCVLTGFDYENGYPLREKIDEYGLNGQVYILGYGKQHEIRYIYQKAVMLCFPSLFEGFGLPLLEAMAVGCPVVCSGETSIPEVVGEAALLFDPFDPNDIAEKIYRVWTTPELRETLANKGKEQAKKFSARKLAARHLEVFRLAAQSYRKRRYLYYHYVYEPLHAFRMHMKRREIQKSDVASI